jgi:hypothetical protein
MAFICVDHNRQLLFPNSYNEFLPDNHLPKFVGSIVKKLGLTPADLPYSGQEKQGFPPLLLLSFLIYSYITGTFTSRTIERNTY